MRKATQPVFVLIIYTATLLQLLYAQNLNLSIQSTDTTSAQISFLKTGAFQDLTSLKEAKTATYDSLITAGFLQLLEEVFYQNNDSSYIAKIKLGKKTNTLHIKEAIGADSIDYYIEFKEAGLFMERKKQQLADLGYPFASINLVLLEQQGSASDTLSAVLVSEKADLRRLDKFEIKGYEDFPPNYTQRIFKRALGKAFSEERLRNLHQQLLNTGFSNSIKEPEVLFSPDSTSVFFYLEKKQANFFDGLLGFNSDEDGNLFISGYLDLKLINNFNYGEQFVLFYRGNGEEQREIKLNAFMPYLFQSPVSLKVGLDIFRRDSLFQNVEQRLDLLYHLSPQLMIGGNIYQIETTDSGDDTQVLSQDADAQFIGLSIDYQQPDNRYPLFFTKTSIYTEAGFGSRDAKTLGEQAIQRYRLEAANNFYINDKHSIYVKTTGGWVNADDYLTGDLMRLGGKNNQRGFLENSIDASLYNIWSTEYRFLAARNFFLHSIFDVGYFQNAALGIEDNLVSFGFGAGLLTRAGVLNISIANGKTGTEKFKFNNSILHLNLNVIF
ncbi:MAG: hypothetical protein RQ756_07825 [Flavobacteriaceae bacterium]|nr:hypothetical protein [Flavobacteriaceae bacterium]